jgi:hypothetical protein
MGVMTAYGVIVCSEMGGRWAELASARSDVLAEYRGQGEEVLTVCHWGLVGGGSCRRSPAWDQPAIAAWSKMETVSFFLSLRQNQQLSCNGD